MQEGNFKNKKKSRIPIVLLEFGILLLEFYLSFSVILSEVEGLEFGI